MINNDTVSTATDLMHEEYQAYFTSSVDEDLGYYNSTLTVLASVITNNSLIRCWVTKFNYSYTSFDWSDEARLLVFTSFRKQQYQDNYILYTCIIDLLATNNNLLYLARGNFQEDAVSNQVLFYSNGTHIVLVNVQVCVKI